MLELFIHILMRRKICPVYIFLEGDNRHINVFWYCKKEGHQILIHIYIYYHLRVRRHVKAQSTGGHQEIDRV